MCYWFVTLLDNKNIEQLSMLGEFFTLRILVGPGRCGSGGSALSHPLRSHWFDSVCGTCWGCGLDPQWGVGWGAVHAGAADQCFSSSKINKNIEGKKESWWEVEYSI